MIALERALTVAEVAARTGVPPAAVRELVEEDARRGVVERAERDGWRLTPAAERRYGAALRNLGRWS